MTNKERTGEQIFNHPCIAARCSRLQGQSKGKQYAKQQHGAKSPRSLFFLFGHHQGVCRENSQNDNADLFEIQAAQPYTDADVNWQNDNARVNQEMKAHPDSRPAIARKVDNMKDYDVVFVGFPIWWYIAPNIINTFLEAHDFKGKTIIPFFTSHSSGPGETDKNLHKSINYDVTWKSAVRVNRWNDKELEDWVSHCGKFVSHL